MKICIFGTGKIYNRYKDRLKSNVEIVCLIDNNKDKIGTYIDGIRVVSPNMLKNLEYDYICILSVYEEDMRKQLRDLGVNPGVIILWERCELFLRGINTIRILCLKTVAIRIYLFFLMR